jgi:general secretion pathway protein H
MLRTRRGFTLIEVLVVLVIVAAMAGLVVFSIPDNPARELKREAQGLAALLNTANDEAVMQSRDLGLVINDQGYRFVIFDLEKKTWVPLQQKPLGEHHFEEGYSVQFELDGAQIDDKTRARIDKFIARGAVDTDADLNDGGDSKPTLLLLSSGETTAFSLILRNPKAVFTLSSDGFNPVTVEPGEPGQREGSSSQTSSAQGAST